MNDAMNDAQLAAWNRWYPEQTDEWWATEHINVFVFATPTGAIEVTFNLDGTTSQRDTVLPAQGPAAQLDAGLPHPYGWKEGANS